MFVTQDSSQRGALVTAPYKLSFDYFYYYYYYYYYYDTVKQYYYY